MNVTATRLGAACIALLAAGWATAADVHERTLANGLKILVREDHRAPIVVSQVWYKVGSSYEHDGITGISHLLEHMMFKGTARHGPGEFSRIIAENGGRENAFTGKDYTAYFQTLEKSRLPVALELEADRMRHLRLQAAEFAKEAEVVKEERRLRTEDQPTALLWERFNAAAFQTSPYRTPIVGWMDDLDALTVADLADWYRRWYAPNNATLVVVGDVVPAEVFALAERHFGPLAPSDIQAPKPRREVEQAGLRRIEVRAPAEVPSLLMGWKVPVLRTAADEREAWALEVLASVLDGGSSARLARELVRGSRVAASAGAGYGLTDRLDDLFILTGTPASGHDIAHLEAALRAQVRRLQDEPVAPAEFARILAQVKAQKVYERDSVFYQAMQLGTLATVGLPYQLADDYLARLESVTPAEVQAVARKYFRDERLTVAVLNPLPVEPGRPAPRASGTRH